MPYRRRREPAINVQPGDRLDGPAVFADFGIVKSTTVIDRGVQVNFEDGMKVVRSEGYVFNVVREEQ